MNRKILSLTAALLAGLFTAGAVIGDGHEYGEHEEHEGRWRQWLPQRWSLDVAPVENPQYREECGSCHFAYQPGLLPARSWQRMMGGLDDHFGENAELPAESLRALSDYLLANAADRTDHRRSLAINGSIPKGEAPLRISETRYFQRKHREIPPRLVLDNPKLGSWSRCDGCHTNAAAGSYNEHQVKIPGVGRWDD